MDKQSNQGSKRRGKRRVKAKEEEGEARQTADDLCVS